MFCPAHIVRQSEHPEARLLLANLLRYLDREDVAFATRRVSVAGARIQEAARLLTGADLPAWKSGDEADVILAGPGALATPQAGSISRRGIIALDACGPAAVAWPAGAGTVIATTLDLTRRGDDWQATLGADTLPCAAGIVDDLRPFPDGRYLTFAEIDERVGNVCPLRRAVRGRSFELRLPWVSLGGKPGGDLPFAIELHGPDGNALRLPAGTETDPGALVLSL